MNTSGVKTIKGFVGRRRGSTIAGEPMKHGCRLRGPKTICMFGKGLEKLEPGIFVIADIIVIRACYFN